MSSFDPNAGKWRRRALTLPLMGLAALVALSASPLLLILAPVERLVSPKMALTRTALMVLFYLLVELWGIATLGWIGLRWPGGEALVQHTHQVQLQWTNALFQALVRLFDMKVEVSGAEHLQRAPFILLLNHSSSADTVLPMALAAVPNDHRVRFVLKRELLYDPCLDIAGLRLPNAFVRREDDPKGDMERVNQLARGLDERSIVILYPEGTRFSTARRARQIAALRERGDPALLARAEALSHTLLPRPGGAVSLLQRLPEVDVVLCCHAGLGAARSMGALLRGALVGRRIHVKFRRFSAAELPREREAAYDWLLDRWAEQDAQIAAWSAEDSS